MIKLKNLLILSCCAVLLTGCELYGLLKDFTDKEEGTVVLNDGKTYTGRVSMPLCNSKNVTVATADSQKIKIPAENISVLNVWKNTHKEAVHSLVYRQYIYNLKKNKVLKPQWMAVIESGKNVYFCALSYKYSIPSSGAMKITSVKNGSIYYLAFIKGDKIGKFVALNGYPERSWRKNMINLLSDDPVLCEKLKNMDIEASDMATIAKQYNPK